jgi:hypothetical protein
MTTTELCESAGLSRSNVQQSLECGFLEAENVGIPGAAIAAVVQARRDSFDLVPAISLAS